MPNRVENRDVMPNRAEDRDVIPNRAESPVRNLLFSADER